jgi:hypothetical protein
MCERDRCPDAEDRDADLECGVQPQRLLNSVGASSEDRVPSRQTSEKSAHRHGHGIHVHADDERKLFDPEQLIDECGGTGKNEQGTRRGTVHGGIMSRGTIGP